MVIDMRAVGKLKQNLTVFLLSVFIAHTQERNH